ncbi:M48 family metallopeptidase [Paenibacillus sp. SI8]|uniref:M48 family metallopeptidase n=1 Tax=unclassified Paenibacillus TaxID=185978 RepID=UPI003467C2AC
MQAEKYLSNNQAFDRKIRSKYLLFVPGLYALFLFSIIIITFVGYGIVYVFETFIPPTIAIFLIGACIGVGCGVLFGFYSVLAGLIRSIFPRPQFEVAVAINENEEPEIYRVVRDICSQMGTQMPNHIILNARSRFYVTDASLCLPNGTIKGKILSLSLPMLDFLKLNELYSIISHEIAHFTGWDTDFSKKVSPVYNGSLTTLKHLFHGTVSNRSDLAPFMLLPSLIPMFILRSYLKWFHEVMLVVSRAREYRADTLAAQTCGTRSYTSALEKMHSINVVFEKVSMHHLTGAYKEGRGIINYYEVFRQSYDNLQGEIAQELQYSLNSKSSRDDTHPTLGERLSHLPNDVDNKVSISNDLASTLLIHSGKYERFLSDELSYYLNKS